MIAKSLKKIVKNRKKRIGRGYGSGKGGHTVGRGQKGQKSRGGFHIRNNEPGLKNLTRRSSKFEGNKSRVKKPREVKITLFLDKSIMKINTEVIKKVSKGDVILVGPKDYTAVDLSKIEIESDVKLSNVLKEKILAAGGKVNS